MTQPVNNEASYLPASWRFSEDDNDFLRELNTLYRKIAQAVSEREIARYDCIDQGVPTAPGFERVTGQKWFSANNQTQRPGFRKVVVFPALLAGNNTQPHYLGTLTAYTFTRIDGVLQSAATQQFVPVPNGGANYAFLDVLAANVEITLPVASPWIGFTAVVVLEYLKN
jgi:hypothetical protein